jgi:hypothetical protein
VEEVAVVGDLPGCFNVHANMLEALKISVTSRITNGESRLDLSSEVVLYLIDRAQRWERMNHDLGVHNHRRLP